MAVWGDADIPEWRCDARCVPWRLSLMRVPPVRLSAAVHNNAAWCDAVCRALGGDTTRVDGLWVRPQPFATLLSQCGDAGTLRHGGPAIAPAIDARLGPSPSVGGQGQLPAARPRAARVRSPLRGGMDRPSGGSSTLPAPAISGPAWATVRSDADLLAWERALHGGSTLRPPRASPACSIQHCSTTLTSASLPGHSDGHIVAGMVANRSDDGTGPVVGISNVVPTPGDPLTDGPAVIAAVRDAFPGLPMVGYERGESSRRDARPWLSTLGALAGVAHASWLRRSPSELSQA